MSESRRGSGDGSRAFTTLRNYAKRMFKYTQMDTEMTMWQMVNLCFSPSTVYHTTRYHKQTKNQWARDDPAFVVIFLTFLVTSALAWGVAMHASVVLVLRLLLWVGLVDFFVFGLVTATFGWFLANRFLIFKSNLAPRNSGMGQNTDSLGRGARDPEAGSGSDSDDIRDTTDSFFMLSSQQVEWLYAFDVHLNSYFPVWVILYVIQFLVLPLILRGEGTFLATLLANTMYLAAGIYYYYVTFLGYTALPFLQKTEVFLYPIGVLALLYIISLFLNVNMTIVVANFYFS